MKWETVIGLEIHAQLSTSSKIFSGASTAFGASPNSQACEVDLALPGVLPVLNKGAVERAIKFGLSVGAKISPKSVFARKNYFYPDLPKGYQISQFELPVVEGGSIKIQFGDKQNPQEKTVRITRAHLEEDAGKSLHEDFQGMSGIDLNRASTPLLEIVSEPDMRGPLEAVAYAKTIHSLVRYLEICDGNMQEGSFRVDANISVRPEGQEKFGTRCEIKNVNSFKYLEKAIEFEVQRQIEIIEDGGTITQETRLYDSIKDETRSMRSKEEAHDYRYFPDPDLLPLHIGDDWISEVKTTLPELPQAKKERFINEYQLSSYDAGVLTASKEVSVYFENVLDTLGDRSPTTAKLASNWISGDLMGFLNKDGLEFSQSPVSSQQLAKLLSRIQDDTISGKIAKDIFEVMWAGEHNGDADEIIEAKGLKQITDSSAIEKLVDDIMANNPKQLEDYRGGKDKLFGFFVGQAMKLSQGKANPTQLNDILKAKLDNK